MILATSLLRYHLYSHASVYGTGLLVLSELQDRCQVAVEFDLEPTHERYQSYLLDQLSQDFDGFGPAVFAV